MDSKAFLRLLICFILSIEMAFAVDLPGSQDHPEVQRFPGTFIVAYEQKEVANFSLATGMMQKYDGIVQAEYSQKTSGKLTRITYEFSTQYSPTEALNHFYKKLSPNYPSLLFKCDGRECGSSNIWANRYFQQRLLYGKDGSQKLFVAFNDRDVFISVYAIEKGNRRIYAHVDILESDTDDSTKKLFNPVMLVSQLNANGRAILPNLVFNEGELDRQQSAVVLETVVDVLNRNPTFNIVVLGYEPKTGRLADIDALISLATQRATAVQAALVANGIDQTRLKAYGIGPFYALPVNQSVNENQPLSDSQKTNRIELLLW